MLTMATEKRLIDANALLEELEKFENPMPNKSGYDFLCGVATAITEIEDAPTVDAMEVVHGRWEKARIAGYLKCNYCKDAFIYEEWLESGKWNYCPNCGAKMDGDGDG